MPVSLQSNAYATEAEFQRIAGRAVDSGDTNYDLIKEAINRASDFIDEYTGRWFWDRTLTTEKVDVYRYSTNGFKISSTRERIWLPAPVISTSVFTEDSTSLTEDVDYYIDNFQMCILREGRWSGERNAVSITGHFGYSTIPTEITQICLTIAEVISGLGVRTFHDKDGSIQQVLMRNLPNWVMVALDRHKRVLV